MESQEALKRALDLSKREDEFQTHQRQQEDLELQEATRLSLSQQVHDSELEKAKELSRLEQFAFGHAAALQRDDSFAEAVDAQFRAELASLPDYASEAETHLQQRGISKSEDTVRSSQTEPLQLRESPSDSTLVFVDNSNIILGGSRLGVMVDIKALVNRVEFSRGSSIEKRVVFGSKPGSDKVFSDWKRAGYDVHTSVRPAGCGEQFVDDACVAMILTAVAREHLPKTIVLLTGDGNGNDGRANFFEAVCIALLKGWKCEVWSWRAGQSSKYRDLERAYEGTGRYLLQSLDAFQCELNTGGVPIRSPKLLQPVSQHNPALALPIRSQPSCSGSNSSVGKSGTGKGGYRRDGYKGGGYKGGGKGDHGKGKGRSKGGFQLPQAALPMSVNQQAAANRLQPAGGSQQTMLSGRQPADLSHKAVALRRHLAGSSQQAAAIMQRQQAAGSRQQQAAAIINRRRQQAIAGKWQPADGRRLWNGRPHTIKHWVK